MNALEELKNCPDIGTLKAALQKLCKKFGRIANLDVLTTMQEGSRRAICFLRMDSPENEQVLMKALGVGRFGKEIVFVVDLAAPLISENEGPSSEWADIEGPSSDRADIEGPSSDRADLL